MPANLSPEYIAAEKEYRATKDPQAKLACLERMLSTIPKHKGTEKMQSDIKRRIARQKDSLEKKGGKKGFSYSVERGGAAQVVLLGAPNAGKSALVEATTNARVEVADYPFSTRVPVPAMMSYLDLQFQLVDLPPVSSEYMEYWVIDIIRNTDVAIWVVCAADQEIKSKIKEVSDLLQQRKIELVGPAGPRNKGQDVIRKVPCLVLASKMDVDGADENLELIKEIFEPATPVLPVSALGDSEFEELAKALFDINRIVRVYSKSPNKDPDFSRPYVMHRGDRLIDFARVVHRDFAENLSYARAWGEGKFDGQRIQRDHELLDGDVVELRV